VRSIEDEITIRATPERTWSVLTDFASYAEWNPFIRQIAGEIRIGARLHVTIQPPGGMAMAFRPRLTEVSPARRLRWLGRLFLPGLFDGAHAFEIGPQPGGEVRFRQSERFRGILVSLLPGSLYEKTRRGFAEMNLALKRRAET
jgi:hypothetical protein